MDELPEGFFETKRLEVELGGILLGLFDAKPWSQRRSAILTAENVELLIVAELDGPRAVTRARRAWLYAQLRKRYPAAFGVRVIRQFGAKADLELVREFWNFTHDRAAVPALLVIAGRKSEELAVRKESLRLLIMWTLPKDRERTRSRLAAILLDETDDVRVRGAAATALGRMGDRRSIPALRRQLLRPTPERPVFINSVRHRDAYLDRFDLRGPVALALADLGATEAIPELEATLGDGVTPERRAKMRGEVALALSRLR